MCPAPYREQTAICIFGLNSGAKNDVGKQSNYTCDARYIETIRQNSNGWLARLRRGSCLVFGARYYLIEVLLMVIVNFIKKIHPPIPLWHVHNGKLQPLNIIHAIILIIFMNIQVKREGVMLWIKERQKEDLILVKFCRWPLAP